MKLNNLPYIVIIGLLVIIILQYKGCIGPKPEQIVRIDTVIVEKIIRDTIPGKTVYIKGEKDTIWITEGDFVPKPTYEALLKQYTDLGMAYFARNTFETTFQIADYGTVIVTDTISRNLLLGSSIATDLKIPTTTITKEVPIPPKTQLYAGFTLIGNKTSPISGAFGNLLLKTKKDQLFGATVGYNGELQIGGSMYWKIKLK